MKPLHFDGFDFQYEVNYLESEYGTGDYTNFYLGTEEVRRPQLRFWKGLVTEIRPKKVFSIGISIESPHMTKKQIRALIQNQVDLLRRQEEIKRGEFV